LILPCVGSNPAAPAIFRKNASPKGLAFFYARDLWLGLTVA